MVTNNEQHILQMPVVSLIDCTQNVKAFGKGIAEFAGLQVYTIKNISTSLAHANNICPIRLRNTLTMPLCKTLAFRLHRAITKKILYRYGPDMEGS